MNFDRRGPTNILRRAFNRVVVNDEDFVDHADVFEIVNDLANGFFLVIGRQNNTYFRLLVHQRCATASICPASGRQNDAR